MTIPVALTIAGSDSGGGAGIQADLKTFSALGVFGTSAITAVTAQNTCSVTAIHLVPAQVVAEQIRAVLSDIDVKSIKIGMLATLEIIITVAEAIEGFQGAVVLDPVMVAKSGDLLLQKEAVGALNRWLIPRATLVTPNLLEAAHLLGTTIASSSAEIQAQGHAFIAQGAKAVLMKGGHAGGQTCRDLLIDADIETIFESPRLATHNTHGTGCSLSSAIAAELAKGTDLKTAAGSAHHWLHQSIKAADKLNIGKGHGPVHHFHAVWR